MQAKFPPLSTLKYRKRLHDDSTPLAVGVGSFGDEQTSQVVHLTDTTFSCPPERVTSFREASPSS